MPSNRGRVLTPLHLAFWAIKAELQKTRLVHFFLRRAVLAILYRGGLKIGSQVAKFFRQVEAELVGTNRNKILQTWEPLFSPTLYIVNLESST